MCLAAFGVVHTPPPMVTSQIVDEMFDEFVKRQACQNGEKTRIIGIRTVLKSR
jgi:hypothetical protein